MRVPGLTTKIQRQPALNPGAEYTITHKGGAPKTRYSFQISGLAGLTGFTVHNNCFANAWRALSERVFSVEKDGKLVPTPQSAPGVFERLSRFREKLLESAPVIPAMSDEQFIARYQDGRRKQIYTAAAEQLRRDGIKSKDARIEAFVKVEKVNVGKKTDPAPRLIQPRKPVYNVAVGKQIAHLEKPLYRLIGKVWRGPTVMKGYNAHDTARHMHDMWNEFERPVAIGLDASRFDQHVGVDALRFEHSVYLSMIPHQERARCERLLRMQLRNFGIVRTPDGVIKYAIDGCRMSGDMNTAMGNCLLMSAMIWQMCEEAGLRARLANNGDDCVIIMDERDRKRLPDIESWFREFGFSMKVERPVYEFEQIEFCQAHPVYDGARWIMCRDPRVCLAKDAVSVLPMQMPKVAKGWYTAVGRCGMSLAGGLPVLQEAYNAYIRAGEGVEIGHTLQHESGFFHLARGMHRDYAEPTPSARLSFYKAFGITPTAQLVIEGRMRSLDISCVVSQGIIQPLFNPLLFSC